ncbi:hypothetical protein ACFGOO_09870 [Treponema vincentii]|uniref:hypothetical protein n=1 Tax=Treponema vincentii TaxID=69710 RepID=UPI0035F56384
MEFDKSRVYTAVNADELKVGSRVVLCDSLLELKEAVETEKKRTIQNLAIIHGEDMPFRFTGDKYHSGHSLAYLVELPKEPECRPFESIKKAMEAIKKHGGWVKDKTTDDLKLITSIGKISDSVGSIGAGGSYYTFTTFLDRYVFADDGSPCGELVKE